MRDASLEVGRLNLPDGHTPASTPDEDVREEFERLVGITQEVEVVAS